MSHCQSVVLWISGQSGCSAFAGIASRLKNRLASQGFQAVVIDGLKSVSTRSTPNNNPAFLRQELTIRTAELLQLSGIEGIIITLLPPAPDSEGKELTTVHINDPLAAPCIVRTRRENPEETVQAIYEYLLIKGYIDEQEGWLDSIYQPNMIEKILSLFPFPSLALLIQFVVRNNLRQGLAHFVDDCLQFIKIRRYPHKQRVIFIAGLPKAGTTWLRNMLGLIPGYHIRPAFDFTRATLFHNITPLLFHNIPNYSYSVVKLHTKYTPYNFKTIRENVGKFIVLHRDLRDMCVSRYFHVLNEDTHRHASIYRSLSKEEGLFHSINIVKQEYLQWVEQWHEIARNNPDTILEIRYEDLKRNAAITLQQILSFLELSYTQHLLDTMVKTQLKKPVDLKKSLKKDDTKRKGIIGDWKNHFSEDHKKHFKNFAGELLISLGYEKNLDW